VILNFTRIHALVLLALGCIAVVLFWNLWPGANVGFVQINTVPSAPLTQTALFLDSKKLDPIRQGNALLRQSVGTMKLQSSDYNGTMLPLCNIEVKRDRITTVTISLLERPRRCQCRFSGGNSNHTCIS
jgi:hypothetical protein